jgi:hypothetical protein
MSTYVSKCRGHHSFLEHCIKWDVNSHVQQISGERDEGMGGEWAPETSGSGGIGIDHEFDLMMMGGGGIGISAGIDAGAGAGASGGGGDSQEFDLLLENLDLLGEAGYDAAAEMEQEADRAIRGGMQGLGYNEDMSLITKTVRLSGGGMAPVGADTLRRFGRV